MVANRLKHKLAVAVASVERVTESCESLVQKHKKDISTNEERSRTVPVPKEIDL